MLRYTILLLAVVGDAAAQFGGGGFDGMNFGGMGGKNCRKHTCGKGKTPVPKWPMRLKSPGCSNLGMSMQTFNPGGGKDGNEDVTTCCDLYHSCLAICGIGKKECDTNFKKCTDKACNAIEDEEEKKSCTSSAGMHVLTVQMGTCQKYEQTQYTQCDCIDDSGVEKARKHVLRRFYKKFNPDKVDEVKNLAKKKNTVSKFGRLMNNLVAKYPAVIKKVEDPQQKYWEDMMAKAGDDAEKAPDANPDIPADPTSDGEEVQEPDAAASGAAADGNGEDDATTGEQAGEPDAGDAQPEPPVGSEGETAEPPTDASEPEKEPAPESDADAETGADTEVEPEPEKPPPPPPKPPPPPPPPKKKKTRKPKKIRVPEPDPADEDGEEVFEEEEDDAGGAAPHTEL